MHTAIFGDIHGDVERLRLALKALENRVDELIFLGDYVDRGPASRQVIDELIQLERRRSAQVIFLRGNHDQALLDFLNGSDRAVFVSQGGLATVKSYLLEKTDKPLVEFRKQFPPEHIRFLEDTELYYEGPGILISHCGYNPALPSRRNLADMVTGSFPELFRPVDRRPRDLVVFGHYVQEDRYAFNRDGLVCLDTGCGTLPDGPLTALLLPEHEIMQF